MANPGQAPNLPSKVITKNHVNNCVEEIQASGKIQTQNTWTDDQHYNQWAKEISQ